MLVMRWKAVRFAPARDRSVPDEQWRFELYDPEADPDGTTDVHAAHPGADGGPHHPAPGRMGGFLPA
jgi:hypothetical protein